MKRRWAQMIYERPSNQEERVAAARRLFPLDNQKAYAEQCAIKWMDDPIVQAELVRLSSSGSEHNLPTKADVARRWINWADDKDLNIDTRMKALGKYEDLMGYKPEQGARLGVGTVINNNRVIVLPAQVESLAQWEQGAMSQQQNLIASNDPKVIEGHAVKK